MKRWLSQDRLRPRLLRLSCPFRLSRTNARDSKKMDANGTFFHLLLGRTDWGNCLDAQMRPLRKSWDDSKHGAALNRSGTDWDEERAELILQQRLFRFDTEPQRERPELKERRGAARDRYGNWYWIDQSEREILVNSSGTQTVSHFWSSTDQCAGNC